MAPSADESLARWWMARARAAASPGSARDLVMMNSQADIRDVLPAVQAPTLVIHRTGDRDARVEEGRYIAAHVHGARFVELAGDTHVPFWQPDDVVDEVEEFLTGLRPTRVADRVLATILFTDLVGSTERAGALGDHAWAELLERHHQVVRRELARFGGEEIDTAGDGFLALFDGPARAIRCALAIRDGLAELGLEVRAGVHTGEVERPRGGGPRGISVHTGARIAAAGSAGDVLVSVTTRDLVAGSGLVFADRGEVELKGIGARRLYAATA
jgi:class 3 adenylate cyclase